MSPIDTMSTTFSNEENNPGLHYFGNGKDAPAAAPISMYTNNYSGPGVNYPNLFGTDVSTASSQLVQAQPVPYCLQPEHQPSLLYTHPMPQSTHLFVLGPQSTPTAPQHPPYGQV
jgi:hypothetical protein